MPAMLVSVELITNHVIIIIIIIIIIIGPTH